MRRRTVLVQVGRERRMERARAGIFPDTSPTIGGTHDARASCTPLYQPHHHIGYLMEFTAGTTTSQSSRISMRRRFALLQARRNRPAMLQLNGAQRQVDEHPVSHLSALLDLIVVVALLAGNRGWDAGSAGRHPRQVIHASVVHTSSESCRVVTLSSGLHSVIRISERVCTL